MCPGLWREMWAKKGQCPDSWVHTPLCPVGKPRGRRRAPGNRFFDEAGTLRAMVFFLGEKHFALFRLLCCHTRQMLPAGTAKPRTLMPRDRRKERATTRWPLYFARRVAHFCLLVYIELLLYIVNPRVGLRDVSHREMWNVVKEKEFIIFLTMGMLVLFRKWENGFQDKRRKGQREAMFLSTELEEIKKWNCTWSLDRHGVEWVSSWAGSPGWHEGIGLWTGRGGTGSGETLLEFRTSQPCFLISRTSKMKEK